MAQIDDKYRPEYDQMLLDYFSVETYTDYAQSGTDAPRRLPNAFPTLQGFAAKILKKDPETLRNWAYSRLPDGSLKHPSWAAAYRQAQALQQNFFTINALQGISNTSIAPLLAKTFFGWTMDDKKEKEKEEEKQAENCKEIPLENAHESYTNMMIKSSKIKGLT